MITDCSETVVIFQLQRSTITNEHDVVKSSLALHGGLNPDVKDVFLASASFEFDLENPGMSDII